MEVVLYKGNDTKVVNIELRKGLKGKDGVGLPKGGKAEQILVKKSNTDYDCEWQDNKGGGGKQVQADWNEKSISSPAFIRNKPNDLVNESELNRRIGFIEQGLTNIIGG